MHRPPLSRLPCLDCGVNTARIGEYYNVRPPVWEASGLAYDGGFLCVGCLEKRIGRELNYEDFQPGKTNHGQYWRQDVRRHIFPSA